MLFRRLYSELRSLLQSCAPRVCSDRLCSHCPPCTDLVAPLQNLTVTWVLSRGSFRSAAQHPLTVLGTHLESTNLEPVLYTSELRADRILAGDTNSLQALQGF